jgi:Ricin-type beta-trefoil lectin domain
VPAFMNPHQVPEATDDREIHPEAAPRIAAQRCRPRRPATSAGADRGGGCLRRGRRARRGSAGLSTTAGTQLDIWTCNGGANQLWTHSSANQLTVHSGSSQMCLDAYGNGTTAGTKVVIWTCNGGANQQWNVNANGTITGVQSGLCLDVTGASTANGALVELWTCNGGSNQQGTLG